MAKPEDTLILETTKGTVKIAMRPDLAPGHVARIKELVKEGFYDGIVFHRVIDGFMAQTGCPQGTGTGGSGKTIPLEVTPNLKHGEAGAVAMARSSAPNSASCQFYITLGPTPFLDGNYAVFGRVTEGLDVVKSIRVGDVMTRVSIEGQ